MCCIPFVCSHAAARAKADTTISVEAGTPHSLTDFYLSKSLTIQGSPDPETDEKPHIEMDIIVTGTPENPCILHLAGVKVSGRIRLGDAIVKLTDSTLDGAVIEQEPTRGKPSHVVGLVLERVTALNSTIQTLPKDSGRYQNVYNTTVELTSVRFVNTLINITSVDVSVRLQNIKISSNVHENWNNSFDVPVGGIFINVGYPAKLNDSQTFTGDEGRKRRRKRQASPSVEGDLFRPASTIEVLDSLFSGLLFKKDHGGMAALTIHARKDFSLVIKNTTFLNNARAVLIEAEEGLKRGSMFASESVFMGNKALGPGGAIHLDQHHGYFNLRVINSEFRENVAIGLVTSNEISTNRVSNISGSGGAIGVLVKASQGDPLTRCAVDILNCTFENNAAESYGGSVYFTSGVVASISSSDFSNGLQPNLRPRIGDLLESHGNMFLTNSTFQVSSSDDAVPILSYHAEQDGQFLHAENVKFICPKGHQAKPIYTTVMPGSKSSKVPLETVLVYCQSCNEGTYSLDESHLIITQVAGIEIRHIREPICDVCPKGASCRAGVFAKANFWGETYNGTLHMYLCPANYCCQDSLCTTYDACASNRVGTLCGRCKAGFSESLFSSKCVPDDKCTSTTRFLVIIASYGILCVGILIVQEELGLMVLGFTRWMQKTFKKCKRRYSQLGRLDKGVLAKDAIGPGLDAVYAKETPRGAFLNIFMYYTQTISLVTIGTLYIGNIDTPLYALVNMLLYVFSFNTISLNFSTCLFTATTATVKNLLTLSLIGYLVIVWLLVYAIASVVHRCIRNKKQQVRWFTETTLNAKLVGALLQLAIFTYQVLAENALKLLKCENIRSKADPVLFIDGEVTCYKAWQYFVFTFVILYVFPLPIVLLVGPPLLKQRVLRVRELASSILVPFFGAPILVLLSFRSRSRKRRRETVSSTQEKPPREGGTVWSLAGLLVEPYSDGLPGDICWEGIVALRRLILVIIVTFTSNILLRHILIMLICYLSLAFHIRMRPFVLPLSNFLESLSLGVLLFVSIMNLLKCAYFDSGVLPTGSADRIFQVYDWVEAFLVVLLPVAVASLAALFLLLGGMTLILERCKQCCGGSSSNIADGRSRIKQSDIDDNEHVSQEPAGDDGRSNTALGAPEKVCPVPVSSSSHDEGLTQLPRDHAPRCPSRDPSGHGDIPEQEGYDWSNRYYYVQTRGMYDPTRAGATAESHYYDVHRNDVVKY